MTESWASSNRKSSRGTSSRQPGGAGGRSALSREALSSRESYTLFSATGGRGPPFRNCLREYSPSRGAWGKAAAICRGAAAAPAGAAQVATTVAFWCTAMQHDTPKPAAQERRASAEAQTDAAVTRRGELPLQRRARRAAAAR